MKKFKIKQLVFNEKRECMYTKNDRFRGILESGEEFLGIVHSNRQTRTGKGNRWFVDILVAVPCEEKEK